jgi:hypothetical protein
LKVKLARATFTQVKNHYIPKTYLRRWTADDGKLCQHIRTPDGRIAARRVYPAETGYAVDLYTLSDLPEEHRHFVETVLFKRVDQDAATGLDLYLSNDINAGVTAEKISGWSRFLMSLLHRQPAKIASLKAMAQERFEAIIPEMRAEWGQHPERETTTFDEYIEQGGAAISATLFANVLAMICNSANIGQHMNNMVKSVVTIEEPKHFLTCDNPIKLFTPLEGDEAHILLPISPRKLFVAANHQDIVDRLFDRLRHDDMVEQLNEDTIRKAYLYVYDTHEDETGLVAHHFKGYGSEAADSATAEADFRGDGHEPTQSASG